MTRLQPSLEQWLTAERQLMSRPDALTAFLASKRTMLDAVRFDPGDSLNVGATKSRSHIGQCDRLISAARVNSLGPMDLCRQLGILASKSLKVASGYSMRAGYFYPPEPAELYSDRMIRLLDADGSKIPVLGAGVCDLVKHAIDVVGVEEPHTADDLQDLLETGKQAAQQSDENLQGLLLDQLSFDSDFSGSVGSQVVADRLTVTTKSVFTALSIGALRLQQNGPDGLGPLILEPKSDANANYFLRADQLVPTVVDQTTYVDSPNSLARV